MTWRRSLSQSYIAIPGDKFEFPISLLGISARSLPRIRFGENLNLATISRRARIAGAAAFAMGDHTVSQKPEAIAATAWRIWIMNEQPPTAVPISAACKAAYGSRERYQIGRAR